jgi:hypothetical protein
LSPSDRIGLVDDAFALATAGKTGEGYKKRKRALAFHDDDDDVLVLYQSNDLP